ncbi:hypothetical protein F5Y10DRAFT_139185 [Nemania abortiva]|nr:hypothetical protein F5Y10DRAFT_139185 [Nemania abortiva]
MSNRRSHNRSRSSRHHAQGSHLPRRRREQRNAYEDARPVAEDNLSPGGGIPDDFPDDHPWAEGGPVVSYPNDLAYSTGVPLGLEMVADNRTFNGGHIFRDPTWDRRQASYQSGPHDWPQTSMPSTALSQMDGALPSLSETSFNGSVPPSSWGYQRDLDWAAPSPQDQTTEPDRVRRSSTRARQGSAVFYNEGYDDNAVVFSSTNQPNGAGDQESSDSSGGTSPVNRQEYVDGCINCEDGPWSSERSHRYWHN